MTRPKPRRPRLPEQEVYGSEGAVPPEQALPWETAERWLEEAQYYWLATTRRDGRPYSAPLWAVWYDGGLYFTTTAETSTGKNLAAGSLAVAHTESGAEVVMLEGEATRLAPEDVPAIVVDAYEEKYDWRMDPADPDMPYYVLRPRVARTWLAADVRSTATVWRF